MNIILNPGQSDTKAQDIGLTSTSDMTGLENTLVKIVNAAGVAQFAVPAAVTDLALFLVDSGDVAANLTFAEAPYTGNNARAACSGAINPGDILALDAANWGKVITLPAAPGKYFSPGVAEEAATAGGLVKFRPFPRIVSVKTAQTSTAVSTANATDLPSSEALANALKTTVNALVADVAALIAD